MMNGQIWQRDENTEAAAATDIPAADAQPTMAPAAPAPAAQDDLRGMVAAISRSQAVIEFDLEGRIITANENFLSVMGYSLDEIRGQHHSMFVDADYRRSPEYMDFWRRLNSGEFVADKFKRIGKGGREVWIQASYNPILNANGKPVKFVKFATDITERENQVNEQTAKIEAISRSQAVIEFDLDGTILDANENFLSTVGYQLDEIQGRHHSMFVDAGERESAGYRDFWADLKRGKFRSDKFRRQGKGGKEIWIQASYNPLFDLNGKPFKVVKFASDVTQVEHERMARAEEQNLVVSSLGQGLESLSLGELTFRIENAFPGEYEQLRRDFNSAMERLEETMQAVLSGARSISTGAGEISQASDDLSQRTERQAASLEETAAALEQITATVRATAQNAKQASEIVGSATTAAQEGGQIVETAVKAMTEIENSSRQITEIIGVIDKIAFQTNLLALNAGVEAARAGDAGRGFAVVASEVRALAQRSSEAAKEIETLIKASGKHVDSGVKLVGDTGEALKRIAGQVIEVNSLVNEVSQAAQQQSTGVDEVNVAVGEMDQVTQQNAAMVEEATAASRSLATETDELMKLVNFFKIAGGEVEHTAAPRRTEPVHRPKPVAPRSQAPVVHGNLALKSRPQTDEWEEF